MVLIPLLVILVVMGVFESNIRRSDLLQNSPSKELNEAFVKLQDFIADTDGDLLLENSECVPCTKPEHRIFQGNAF